MEMTYGQDPIFLGSGTASKAIWHPWSKSHLNLRWQFTD